MSSISKLAIRIYCQNVCIIFIYEKLIFHQTKCFPSIYENAMKICCTVFVSSIVYTNINISNMYYKVRKKKRIKYNICIKCRKAMNLLDILRPSRSFGDQHC